jgi:predicted peroxiredoxin
MELGQVTLCTQCAERRGLTQDAIHDRIRIAGAVKFAEEILGDGVQALVY